MDLFNVLKKITKIKNFSTTVDYLTMRILPGFFLASTVLMSFNQYVKTSIVCYTGTTYNGIGFGNFLENSCYLMKKYSSMLANGNLEPFTHNNLYMWFPTILILQTCTLCLPKILWIFIGNHTNCSYILQLANEVNGQDSIEKLTNRLQRFLLHNRNYNFLVGYIVTKWISILVFTANLGFLFYIIFLKDFHYPFMILKDLILGGNEPAPNTMFTSVVMCKVDLHHLSSINPVTSQCLLTWNIYYEKIFSLTTCLLLFSVFLVVCDLLKWTIYYIRKQSILQHYLKNGTNVEHFSKHVSKDMFFLIIMISSNVNDFVAGELVNELYISENVNNLNV